MSKLWTDEQLQEACLGANSITEILIKMNLSKTGNSFKGIKKRMVELDIPIPKWKRIGPIPNARPLEELLTLDGKFIGSSSLKIRLLREKLLDHVCTWCGITSWNDKPISLHLDHINGNNRDNRLENLRILCPNCHSQTDTYCGKVNTKITKCVDCDKSISKLSTRCWSCSRALTKGKEILKLKKINWPSLEYLEERLESISMVALGKELGVSDNAVKKHIRMSRQRENQTLIFPM